jgi:hypothetical protein
MADRADRVEASALRRQDRGRIGAVGFGLLLVAWSLQHSGHGGAHVAVAIGAGSLIASVGLMLPYVLERTAKRCEVRELQNRVNELEEHAVVGVAEMNGQIRRALSQLDGGG